MNQYLFKDRTDAGIALSKKIASLDLTSPVVIALPRGGVPLGDIIAQNLNAPLEVLIVRKIGSPSNREYGIGAMSEDLDPLLKSQDLPEGLTPEIREIIFEERDELIRRVSTYRGPRLLPDVGGRSVILVDDGLATGITAAAAAKFLNTKLPKEIILAVPVGPKILSEYVTKYIDRVICLETPANFFGVGMWYQDFSEVTDREVQAILQRHHPHDPSETAARA